MIWSVEILRQVNVSPSGPDSGFMGLVVRGLRGGFSGFWAAEYPDGDLIAQELNNMGVGAVTRVAGRKEIGRGVEVRVIERVGEAVTPRQDQEKTSW